MGVAHHGQARDSEDDAEDPHHDAPVWITIACTMAAMPPGQTQRACRCQAQAHIWSSPAEAATPHHWRTRMETAGIDDALGSA